MEALSLCLNFRTELSQNLNFLKLFFSNKIYFGCLYCTWVDNLLSKKFSSASGSNCRWSKHTHTHTLLHALTYSRQIAARHKEVGQNAAHCTHSHAHLSLTHTHTRTHTHSTRKRECNLRSITKIHWTLLQHSKECIHFSPVLTSPAATTAMCNITNLTLRTV